MNTDPHDLLEAVSGPDTFLEFVRALVADREDAAEAEAANPSSPYGPDEGGWENVQIESFLKSAVAWAEASHFGTKQGVPKDNPWRQFATFLYCGKIYE